MTRKIFLDGELGAKFGPVFSFTGDTVADALRCVEVNRPEFRKYFIENQDLGFSVKVQGEELEFIEECLLPLKKGDIIITPIPAGSKSGGGKILTAIAIASLFLIPGGQGAGAGLLGTFQTGSAGYLVAASVAVNLAITGIQQLMAPDPSVDKEEDSYLFNGNQRNVLSGDPVPVLYGELAVPGFPISFEVTNDKPIRVTEYTDSRNNTYAYDRYGKEGQGEVDTEGLAGGHFEQRESTSTATKEKSTYSRSQTVVFTDLISEGPIYGLVKGGNSVLFDNSPLSDTVNPAVNLSQTSVNFNISGTDVTITKNSYDGTIVNPTYGGKNLLLRDAYTENDVTASEWTSVDGVHGVLITTTTTTWDAAWERSVSDPAADAVVRLTKNGVLYFEGFIHEVDTTISPQVVARCLPILPDTLDLDGLSTFDLSFDAIFEIDNISADETSMTLVSNPYTPAISGDYKGDITGWVASRFDVDYATFTSKYPNTTVQFRTGTKDQPILKDYTGDGLGTISYTDVGQGPMSGPAHADSEDTGGGDETQTYTLSALTELPTTSVPEVDEIEFLFNYNSFHNKSPNGKTRPGKAWYQIEVDVNKDSVWLGYENLYGTTNETALRHFATSESPISISESIDLTPYKPFDDLRVRITRLSNTDRGYDNRLNDVDSDYTSNTSGSISTVVTTIKEPLNYPYSAVARVTTNSKFFQSVPTRSYHCKGMKVLVPSNYVTRDESASGIANYNRNVTTGVIESTYQDWDGQFRASKVYTNNPAWVFYDMLINNRYGLGRWLDESDIDIYSLYRVARFCDEMVTDGNVGKEPRFTSNYYFTKATDAYKVLKDMATTFNGILYWLDGKVTPIPDQAGDPVYNFAPANVLGGEFAYETTGDRTRANQIIVTWNNPATQYVQEALIVEDKEDILTTGRIIPQEAVAFGATTEGQALRYGRWKLWTARNQTELVSFRTAINAAFLRPGDVINVQDPYRYPAVAQYSGRVSSTGTRTANIVPLDRPTDLQLLSSYELTVLIEEPAAFLVQVGSPNTVTIDGDTYTTGDLIPRDHTGTAITTENQVINLLDDSGAPVIASWKPYTRVETRPVVTASGPDITSLEVGSPGFSAAPNAQTTWVLREILDSNTVEGSAKPYRILSITEDSKHEYSITAVEHYNDKFTSIDNDFILSVDDPVFPYPKPSDDVPAPRNAYIVVENRDSGAINDDATLYWDPPENPDGSLYEHVAYYAILHDVPEVQNPLIIPRGTTSISGVNLPRGTWSVGVLTVSTQDTYSWPTTTYFTVEEFIDSSATRVLGYVLGGISSTPFIVTSAGEARFLDPVHYFTADGNPNDIQFYDGTKVNDYIQDCSGIPQYTADSLENQKYMFFDYDAAGGSPPDYFKLIGYKNDLNLGIEYLYDAGNGSDDYTTNWTSLTGTVTVERGYNIVRGVGTAFTTEIQAGDYIKFNAVEGSPVGSPPIGEKAAKVVFVLSDTDLRIDRSFDVDIGSGASPAGTGAERTIFRNDTNRDCVFAVITNNVSAQTTSPTIDNFEVNTDWLTINPSYNGVDSGNHAFTETTYGPQNIASFNTTDYIIETFNYINSSSSGAVSYSSPDSQTNVTANIRPGLTGLGKYLNTEVIVDDGTNTARGTLSSFDGTTGDITLSTIEYSGTPASGASITIQPNLFDVDNYGKIYGSSDGYADFAKATYLADLGIDFQTTSSSDIDFTTISTTGTVDFALDKAFPIAGGEKVLAIYNFTSGSTKKQYYVSGTVSAYAGSPGTVTVNVDGFDGSGATQTGTWDISILSQKMQLDRSGNLTVCGDISWYCCSDFDFKDNVARIEAPLDKINQIGGYTFVWKDNPANKTGKDVGVLAQEIQKVLPEVVIERNGHLAVDYERIVPLLIEGIRELSSRVEELERKCQ